MTTDIEKLIERLRAKRRGMTCDDYDAILGEAADALACLVAPLPEGMAEEIRVLEDANRPRAARLLESLARENARLAALLTKSSEDNDAWVELLTEHDRLAAENARLEEANIHLTDDTGETWESQCLRARAERDALRVAANHLSQSHFTVERQRDRLKAENAELRARIESTSECGCVLTHPVDPYPCSSADPCTYCRAHALMAKLDAKKGGST